MPALPMPASDAGRMVIKNEHHKTHLKAVLFRAAETGAWVQIGEVRISYPMAHAAMAKVEGVPGPDELGYAYTDVDELGRLGSRIKKVAKKIAKSKLLKGVKAIGKLATAVIPGANLVRTGFKAAQGVVRTAKGFARGGIRGGLSAGIRASASSLSGVDTGMGFYFPSELGAVAKKPAPKKLPAPKPAAKPAAKKAAPKPAAKKAAPKPAAKKAAPKKAAAKKPAKGKAQPKAAAAKPPAIAPATVAKLQTLSEEIVDDAPELAQALQELPETPIEERTLVISRAKEAAKVLAATPPEQRAAVAQEIETRLDAYKVISPTGEVRWVPRAEAEG